MPGLPRLQEIRNAGLSLLAGLAVLAMAAPGRAAEPRSVFVGTYTQPGKSQGIYRLDFDPATGAISHPTLAAEMTNPSFLAIHPDGKTLYAVGEVSTFEGKPAGGAAAFALEGDSLRKRSEASTGSPGPCHLVVDPSGRYLLTANYGGGSVTLLPLGPDGAVGAAAQVVQHEGKSVDPQRQEGPHAHGVHFDPAGKLLAVPDLGLDQVRLYRLDAAAGKLAASKPAFATVAPGSGPRHFAFHPDGKHAYVINEMASTVTVFDYDAARGTLTPAQTISTLPEGVAGSNLSTAEIAVHPSGRFVYGSNRGHDSLAVFVVDPATGTLKAAGHVPTGGKTPRNFAIDPSGRYLLAANQDSDTVVVFRVNLESGELTPTGSSARVPMPVSLLFAP
jgi:6-phosphogluconolactonase